MPESSLDYDVVVVGAGAAGAIAAALLAEQDWQVVLVDAGRSAAGERCVTWISPYVKPILEEAGVPAEQVLETPIAECHFYSADFDKSIQPNIPEENAFIVEQGRFVKHLIGAFAAKKTGHYHAPGSAKRLRLLEDGVSVGLDEGSEIRGKLLILATDYDRAPLEQVGLPVHGPPTSGLWSASYTCPAGAVSPSAAVDYVLGLGSGGFGYRIAHAGRISVGVCLGDSSGKAVTELVHISKAFVEKGLLPADWQSHAAGTSAEWSPAGLALEMEDHVAKRAIAVGLVGGFVASYTNESLYPSMWSAQLACRITGEALTCQQPQDKLRTFEHLWRTTMADHLRSPNTDAQSLLPLVFANQQMADKMLHSLQLGINF